jgi:hypothetical protein
VVGHDGLGHATAVGPVQLAGLQQDPEPLQRTALAAVGDVRLVGVPVRNVLPAASERDGAGQMGNCWARPPAGNRSWMSSSRIPCQRWNEGLTDAAALHAELRERGLGRQRADRPPLRPAIPAGPRRALAGQVTAFAEMRTVRTGSRDLEGWLAAVEAATGPDCASLAAGTGTPARPGHGHQDDQTPGVRPRQLRLAPQARHLALWVTTTTKFAAETELPDRAAGRWLGNLVIVSTHDGDDRSAAGSGVSPRGQFMRFAGRPAWFNDARNAVFARGYHGVQIGHFRGSSWSSHDQFPAVRREVLNRRRARPARAPDQQ